jgi:outer membrane protein assembly factor BamD (BamD/ComL family)
MTVRVLAAVGLMAASLAACKKQSAEELLKTAESEYASVVQSADSVRVSGGDIKKVFQPSIDAYEKVIAGYPGTDQAERALSVLATIRNNDTREPELAIEAYQRYLAAFPDGPQAPTSMFLIGYLYNNELHNTDSAAAAYRRFLEKFPQHEMATSAQFELQNLGKSPDDLLLQNRETEQPPAAAERPRKRVPASKTL